MKSDQRMKDCVFSQTENQICVYEPKSIFKLTYYAVLHTHTHTLSLLTLVDGFTDAIDAFTLIKAIL